MMSWVFLLEHWLQVDSGSEPVPSEHWLGGQWFLVSIYYRWTVVPTEHWLQVNNGSEPIPSET